MYSTVLAIDQSYTRSGLCVARNGELLNYKSLSYEKDWNKQKRRRSVLTAINQLRLVFPIDALIFERPRRFPSFYTLVAMHSFIITVQDSIQASMPIYTVDTRSWKACTVGKASASKAETLLWIEENYGIKGINDDTGDSICIALSYWNDARMEEYV